MKKWIVFCLAGLLFPIAVSGQERVFKYDNIVGLGDYDAVKTYNRLKSEYLQRAVEEVAVIVSSETKIESEATNTSYSETFVEKSKIQSLGKARIVYEKRHSVEDLGDGLKVTASFHIAVDTVAVSKYYNDMIQQKLKEKTRGDITVFVTGTEILQNQTSDIIVSGLQTILSENSITITEKQKDAGLILKIDAKVCNPKTDGRFYYANACVKVILTDVKTGKNEVFVNVTGKGGGLSSQKAGEEAFKSVVNDVWVKVKEEITRN